MPASLRFSRPHLSNWSHWLVRQRRLPCPHACPPPCANKPCPRTAKWHPEHPPCAAAARAPARRNGSPRPHPVPRQP
eukprot:357411-Chlamydomonas_euryale.AAC.2